MCACVINLNACVCDKLQLHTNKKNDVTQNTYHTNTNNVTQCVSKLEVHGKMTNGNNVTHNIKDTIR